MATDTHKETLEFQAEVRQLLNLMINAVYSQREIFLRELISNASDACDKLRFEALTDEALYEDQPELGIRVDYDSQARTITITDDGVGMTRQEVIDNIGTIAKSGTRQFLEQLTGDQAKDARLIGQFGVGFYSAFIVADRVTLTTRRAGLGPEHGVRWESDGSGQFSIETVERPSRGTEVTLHLREGEDEFLDPNTLRQTIRKYSDHISLPIRMKNEDGEDEVVNRAAALWARPKGEIADEEYREFYKHIAHDFEDPLAWTHNQVEGKTVYTSLLYVPSRAPFDIWDRERRHGIKLYVRRVFIMEDTETLMPHYLRFVRGVIDADDLPLNISRELLQRNKAIDSIRSASVKRVLDLLDDIAKNDPERYATFWREFGRVLKEGPAEDFANRERIAKLLRFASTHNDTEEQSVSLDDYTARMKQGQERIYYITADSFAAARSSPHLEVFRRQGIEVLLLYDRVDEWLVSHLSEYDGRPLQSVAKGELDLGELEDTEAKQARDEAAKEYQSLVDKMQEALGDKVQQVRVSHRLTDSPACLVVEQHDLSVNLRHLLKAAGHPVPASSPILEINPEHPLVARLADEQDSQRFADWSHVLFDQALLTEGGQLDDPATFVSRLNELLLLLTGAREDEARERSSGSG